MMRLAAVVLALAVVGTVRADNVIFKDCGSADATINTVDVTPCPQEPCQFVRSHNVSTTVTFTTTKPFTNATNKVYGLILGQKIPFPIAADACQNMPCPGKAGDHVTYKNNVYVNPLFPHVSVVVQWEVMDQDNKPIICFNVPVQITG